MSQAEVEVKVASAESKKKRGRPSKKDGKVDGDKAKKEEGAKRVKKAKKPKSGIKRGLSAYMYYVKETRPDLKLKNPTLGFGDLGKAVGEAWRQLSDDEKKPFHDKAAADKQRYEAEKALVKDEPEAAASDSGAQAAPKKGKAKRKRAAEDESAEGAKPKKAKAPRKQRKVKDAAGSTEAAAAAPAAAAS